jgi:preprotein translocase SecE subunit
VAENDRESAKPKKRRLRTSGSGETIRERAEKSGLKQEKQAKKSAEPNIFSSFWWGFTWPIRTIGRGFKWLGRFRAVRIIGRVFRIIGRIIFPRYIRNSFRELRLVTWPDRRTSWRLTYAVIVFSIIFGLIVAGLDWVLGKIFKEIIIK